MLKYTDTQVTFSEVPDEISLCINISNCPNHCPDCHSKELWEDIGEPLNVGKLCDLVAANKGITCICFMGGDADTGELFALFEFCSRLFEGIKVAWYTGRDTIPLALPEEVDYIKIGPYKKECGPLNNPKTNQRMYCRGKHLHKLDANKEEFYDITNKFWKNDSDI